MGAELGGLGMTEQREDGALARRPRRDGGGGREGVDDVEPAAHEHRKGDEPERLHGSHAAPLQAARAGLVQPLVDEATFGALDLVARRGPRGARDHLHVVARPDDVVRQVVEVALAAAPDVGPRERVDDRDPQRHGVTPY